LGTAAKRERRARRRELANGRSLSCEAIPVGTERILWMEVDGSGAQERRPRGREGGTSRLVGHDGVGVRTVVFDFRSGQ